MQSNWIYVIRHYSLFFYLRLQKYKKIAKGGEKKRKKSTCRFDSVYHIKRI